MARSGALPEIDPTDVFAGGGEMGARMHAMDWTRTAVGPVSTWPHSLKTTLRILLGSRYAMWLGWGPDFTFFCNDAYRPTLGEKDAWALGASAREVWSEIWPDVGPRAQAVLDTGVATWDEGLLLFLERSGYPEETYHTFSYSPVPDDAGHVGGMLCVVTEETERVIGARRLALLHEVASDFGAAHTEDAVFAALEQRVRARPRDLPVLLVYLFEDEAASARLVSASGTRAGTPASPPLLDLRSAEAPVWPAHEILAGRGPLVVDDLERHVGTLPGGPWDRSARQAVVVPLRQQGQERPAGFLVAAINPYRPFDGSYRGFVELLAGEVAGAVANVRAHEQERRRAEALAELDRAKTTFFSNVSHEFRTPLTLLLGPLEDALADPTLSADQRIRLETMNRNTARLLKLVNGLLDFVRIEAGRIDVAYEPTDLAAFTTDLASTFRSACERAGIELRVDAQLDEPAHVDTGMWEKITLNLLSNAFKFTFEGHISVSLRRAGRFAELTVTDTGTGIPEEELPHVFERFHRVEGATGRTAEGTGIGLALVSELVKLHHGTIQVMSRRGAGTTFKVQIPLGVAHLPPERIRAARAGAPSSWTAEPYVAEALRWLDPALEGSESATSAATMGGASPEAADAQAVTTGRPAILLADDNRDMREYVARLLSSRYDVRAVADGEAALASAAASPPDLVLSDIMMPRLDGFQLLAALRQDERTRTVPVILLSARAGEEARVEGLSRGADDYLVKPFSARELLARVATLLELSQVRREAAEAIERREARLRTALDAARMAAWEYDLSSREIRIVTHGDSVRFDDRGGSFPVAERLRLVHPEDDEALRAVVREALASGAPFVYQLRLRTRNGEYRWAELHGRVVRDGEAPARIDGVVQDITERKRTEEALVEGDRRKDEFLATLAHELRNPLAPIRNAFQILRVSETSEAMRTRVYDIVDRQLDHMVRLVDDLLEISRITRGKIELRMEEVDLASSVRSAIDTSRPLIDAAGHALDVSFPADPLTVLGDGMRLSQMIANLLNNAAKFTDSGGLIRVQLLRQGDEALVVVRDNGVGIPRDMLPRVFDLFTQVDRTRRAAQGGLGIGLALVKSLVSMHGGRIEAHSEGPDQGSEFTIHLPLAPVTTSENRDHEDHQGERMLPRIRVLVVDDNQDAADSLAMLLELLGASVAVAHDGPSALAELARVRPSAVLMDIGLPGMDGFEVARIIRRDPTLSKLLLIALTGWGQEEDRRRAHEAGFDHHLVKPADLAVLKSLLAAAR
jgi:signal transduction histidine kinase